MLASSQDVLEQRNLPEKPNYAALSYSWGMNKSGDASLNRHILIRGRRKRVT